MQEMTRSAPIVWLLSQRKEQPSRLALAANPSPTAARLAKSSTGERADISSSAYHWKTDESRATQITPGAISRRETNVQYVSKRFGRILSWQLSLAVIHFMASASKVCVVSVSFRPALFAAPTSRLALSSCLNRQLAAIFSLNGALGFRVERGRIWRRTKSRKWRRYMNYGNEQP